MQRFKDAFVDQLAKLSATGLALIALAAFGAAAAAGSTLPLYVGVPIAVLSVLCGIGVIRVLTHKAFVIYPRRRAQLELTCKRLTYTVDAATPSVVVYHKYYSLRALVDGVGSFTDVYRWSGTDEAKPKICGGDGFRLVDLGPDGVWQRYQVNFPAELPKGASCEFELEWVLNDADRHAQPFVSSPINEPTRRLEFELTLPESWFPQRVWYEVKRSIDSTHIFESSALDRTGGLIKWGVSDPALYHYYVIKWLRNECP